MAKGKKVFAGQRKPFCMAGSILIILAGLLFVGTAATVRAYDGSWFCPLCGHEGGVGVCPTCGRPGMRGGHCCQIAGAGGGMMGGGGMGGGMMMREPGPGCPPRPEQPPKPLDEKEALALLSSYLRQNRNPNLKPGKIKDMESYFEAEIVTKEGSLVDKIQIDKESGWFRSIY